MSELALEITGLSKHYSGLKALDQVDLRVSKGEIRGLIGPNGAGKSTLVDLVTGRTPATSGRVLLNGGDISGKDIRKRRMAGLSRTFQRTSIFPRLTVANNIAVACLKFPETDAHSIVDRMGLTPLLERTADEISYGELRRLDVALAMVGDPQVLLLDEPAAGLSKEDSRQLADRLQSLARSMGVTVVLIEHDMDVVFGISDKITVLEAGRVLAEGLPDEVRRNEAVVRAYLGSSK